MVGLVKCWAVLRAPAGKRLAPMLEVLVPILRRDGELDLTDTEAALLVAMSAATIDRRLAGERAKMMSRGRSHTKPGSLLKSQIPIPHRGNSPIDNTYWDPDVFVGCQCSLALASIYVIGGPVFGSWCGLRPRSVSRLLRIGRRVVRRVLGGSRPCRRPRVRGLGGVAL